jgi:NAD(P)-dependent dehydrogenase (short-subunit alcohol dehydrogenase family)
VFCRKLVDEAVKGLGGLDILVSNAGRQQAQDSILDISDEDFDATIKTNIYAPFWIIKAALPHLKPGSVIIGTTSEQAYDPTPDLYDYAQTKAATMNSVKSLAKQLGPRGSPTAGHRFNPNKLTAKFSASLVSEQGRHVHFTYDRSLPYRAS